MQAIRRVGAGPCGKHRAVTPKDAVLITPYRDGPLLVRGRFELLDADGSPIGRRRNPVALCRCGKSKTRPFCDGTHKLIGFRAPASDGDSTADRG
jgi:CDGSH-type Zn-finger protein